jgi:hypothetical protein
MTRTAVAIGLLVWFGATLLLTEWRRFSRPSLADRLAPYAPGEAQRQAGRGILSVESLGDALGPLAGVLGDRVARVFGVNEGLDTRLRRIHSPWTARHSDSANWRGRQPRLRSASSWSPWVSPCPSPSSS